MQVTKTHRGSTVLMLVALLSPDARSATPSEPLGVVAAAGNGSATISFSAPASDGGNPILGYTITSSPGGFTATGAASPLSMAALVNGLSYTFRVTATNASGAGPASLASNPVTPFDRVLTHGFEPDFAVPQTFSTGTGPASVAGSDINADGRPDLVVANVGSNSVSVLLNSSVLGTSAPTFAAQQSFATGVGPVAVIAADINSDGRPDLVATNWSGNTGNTLSVLLNTTDAGGSAAFSTQQVFAAQQAPYDIASADLNGDGRVDLAVTNQNSNSVSVLLNTTARGAASASFAAQQAFAAGSKPQSVAIADMNGDGKADLVVADHANVGTINVLRNTTAPGAATPGFAAAQTLSVAANPVSVRAADMNGDGIPDIVVTSYTDYTISVLRNQTLAGAMTFDFAAAQTFPVGPAPVFLATPDLNGDGKLDVVTTNAANDTVSVLLNTSPIGATTFTFTTEPAFATGANPICVTAADVNGDARPDLLTANNGATTGNTASVLLNWMTWPTP